jgi:hypothetical protein
MWDFLFVTIIALVVIFPFWMIFSKAGFPGWLALTMLVPVLNVAMLFYLAFAEWPIHRTVPRTDR